MTEQEPLSNAELDAIDAWWRAANYLSVGQIYLLANPLLTEPLRPEHVKPRLLGHWGTTPGLNLIYAHLNRVIRNHDLDAIYVCGPGHGGPGMVANTYLEGTYSEMYPSITQDAIGMGRLFRQFSFPGGIPSHVAPETPGSIHEGGELGYSLAHAYGAAFDNPDLIVACVIGDGEAETGPLAGSWHSDKFLNPATDGAVLPILHLNGYKIANPTVLARIPHSRARVAAARLRLRPSTPSTGDDPERCTAVRRDAGRGHRRDPRHPAAGPRGRRSQPPGLADDRADARPRAGPGPRKWTGCRSRAPGGRTRCRSPRRAEPRAPGHARDVDALVPRRRNCSTPRRPAARAGRAGPARGPADEREPERQRRPAAPRAAAARLQGLRGGGARAGHDFRRGHPGARHLAARRDRR